MKLKTTQHKLGSNKIWQLPFWRRSGSQYCFRLVQNMPTFPAELLELGVKLKGNIKGKQTKHVCEKLFTFCLEKFHRLSPKLSKKLRPEMPVFLAA